MVAAAAPPLPRGPTPRPALDGPGLPSFVDSSANLSYGWIYVTDALDWALFRTGRCIEEAAFAALCSVPYAALGPLPAVGE